MILKALGLDVGQAYGTNFILLSSGQIGHSLPSPLQYFSDNFTWAFACLPPLLHRQQVLMEKGYF